MTAHHTFTAARNLSDIGRDWRKVGGPLHGSPLGPDWDVRIIATGKLYRISDFAYQRLLKHNAEPSPEGWQEISEDGEPVEFPEQDRACSAADRDYQFTKENF